MFAYILFVSWVVLFAGCKAATEVCHEFYLPCNNGACIEERVWCDSELDCADGSDEQYCKFSSATDTDPNRCDPSRFFKCLDGPCLPIAGRCDGYGNCNDNSDEDNCGGKSEDLIKLARSEALSPVARPSNSSYAHPKSAETKYIQENVYPTSGLREGLADSSSFTDLDSTIFDSQRRKARAWLFSERKDFGWEDDTHRALIALSLSSDMPNRKDEDSLLMAKQLDILLSVALTRNQTKPMVLTDLSLFINALQATCRNPRNFYGYDLVSTLRHRVDDMIQKGEFVTPQVYLTLCIHGMSGYNDLRKLHEILLSRNPEIDRIDLQAITVLAAVCMSKIPNDQGLKTSVLHNGLDKLLARIKHEGLPGNVYEVALLVQALNEARVDELEWKREEAVQFIMNRQQENGSFGNVLATYYVLPIVSGRSILSLKDHCNRPNLSDVLPLEVVKNTKRKKMTVNYSLYYGDPTEITQTMKIHVAENTSFYDIMRVAQDVNSNYRFELDNDKDIPVVYSIGGKPNDAERGIYWILHTASNRRSNLPHDHLIPFEGSVHRLYPKHGDELVFWIKPLVSS